jgi:hypothetical protein
VVLQCWSISVAGLGAGTADGVVSSNGGLVVVVCHDGRQPCMWVWCCALIPRDLFYVRHFSHTSLIVQNFRTLIFFHFFLSLGFFVKF